MVRNFLIRQASKVIGWYFSLILLECIIPFILLTINVPAMEDLINVIPTVSAANQKPLLDAILWFVITHFIYESTWRLRDWVKLKFSLYVKFNSFNDLIQQVIRFDSIFFKNHDTVGIVYITKHISDSTERLLSIYVRGLRYCLYLVLIPIKVFNINILCGLVLLVWIAIWLAASFIMFHCVSRDAIRLSDSKNRLLSSFSDTLFNIDNVFIYKTYEHEEAKLNLKLQRIMKQDQNLQMCFWYLWVVQGTMFALVIYAAFITLASGGQLEAGRFAALYKVISELSDSMWSSSEYILDFVENYGKIRNGLDIFSRSPTLQLTDCPSKSCFNHQDGSRYIKFSDVEFRHNDLVSFKFNCTINENQLTALVGRSGSGKTTFIRLLLGMLTPSDGEIINTIAGKNDLYPFTYIPQNIYLFHESLRYNLLYGIRRNVSDEEIKHALEVASCNFVDQLKDGYDTIVCRQNLSGGQAQRLLIARSVLMGSKILVFDEPTSSLDFRTEQDIMQYIYKLNTTRIIIAHKINTIKNADRIIVFDDGQIVGIGNHESLQNNPHYLTLLEPQA